MGEARNSAGRRATYADVESWAAVVVVGDGLAASRPHHSYPCTERARCLRRGQSLVVWAGGPGTSGTASVAPRPASNRRGSRVVR